MDATIYGQPVPWRRKFGVGRYGGGGGWRVRILCGIFWLHVAWRATSYLHHDDVRETVVGVGWIPLRIGNGGVMPGKNLLYRAETGYQREAL